MITSPKALSPNIVTLRVKIPKYELRGTQSSIKQPLWFLFCVLCMYITFPIPSSLASYFHSCFLKVNISKCLSLSSSLFYTLFHFSFIPMFLLWSILSPLHTFYNSSINIDTLIYISCFIFFCEMLLNIYILGTETLYNTFKICCFLQIHSIKCSHLLFTILEILSVFLYGPVALCFFWTVSVNWFPFLSALCFAKTRGSLLFLVFWYKTVISRYWNENKSLTVKKYGCHCVTQ